MCSCGGSSGAPAESYVVTRADKTSTEFTDKVAAEVGKSRTGGVITVTRK